MEKSSFQQMFNQLSHRLKEKRALLGIAEKMEDQESADSAQPRPTTMDLLKNMECSASASSHVGDLSSKANSIANAALNDLRKDVNGETVKTDQITIFYAGSVHVFEDFPVDKMKAVMSYAANFSPVHISGHFVINGGGSDKTSHGKLMAGAQNSSVGAGLSNAEASASDLPIARRASLHRFLSKRKDRASARAPYVRNSPTAASEHGEARSIHRPRSRFFREP